MRCSQHNKGLLCKPMGIGMQQQSKQHFIIIFKSKFCSFKLKKKELVNDIYSTHKNN
jgi:hypothetical protein